MLSRVTPGLCGEVECGNRLTLLRRGNRILRVGGDGACKWAGEEDEAGSDLGTAWFRRTVFFFSLFPSANLSVLSFFFSVGPLPKLSISSRPVFPTRSRISLSSLSFRFFPLFLISVSTSLCSSGSLSVLREFLLGRLGVDRHFKNNLSRRRPADI